MGLKKGGLKARGDEGALRFQLIKAKAVTGMQLCGMQETVFDNAKHVKKHRGNRLYTQ